MSPERSPRLDDGHRGTRLHLGGVRAGLTAAIDEAACVDGTGADRERSGDDDRDTGRR
jgi:hypothetical protein